MSPIRQVWVVSPHTLIVVPTTPSVTDIWSEPPKEPAGTVPTTRHANCGMTLGDARFCMVERVKQNEISPVACLTKMVPVAPLAETNSGDVAPNAGLPVSSIPKRSADIRVEIRDFDGRVT